MNRICLLLLAIGIALGLHARKRTDGELTGAAAAVLAPPAGRAAATVTASLGVVCRMEAISVVGGPSTGFAVVSNDTRLRPVLAYTNSSFAGISSLPPALQWYLQALDRQLSRMALAGSFPRPIVPSASHKTRVAPLLLTDWSQGQPFNDWLPTYTDSTGTERHCLVGCGAVALAQTMYYHRHPQTGRRQLSYSYPVDDSGRRDYIACRFDTISFQWDRMALKYGMKRSTDELQNEAVARLCRAAGVAQLMCYMGADGSSSDIYDMAEGMRYYFDYSPDTHTLLRYYYDDRVWMDIIFGELSEGRPVIYAGRPSPMESGHVFVLDGYDEQGLVHVNWGWSRNETFDGYYDLSCLRPNHTDEDYSDYQRMIVGARPAGTPVNMTAIGLTQPGTLADKLTDSDMPVAWRLKISGPLSHDDLQLLHRLARGLRNGQGQIATHLTHLDLSGAQLPGDTLPPLAFDSCLTLVDVQLPATLCHIADSAFIACEALCRVGMPATLISIGTDAFRYCSNLMNPLLPASLQHIGAGAFSACELIDSFRVEQGNRHFAAVDGMLTNATRNRLITFPIGRYSATIPATIDSIADQAFRYCYHLRRLNLPANVAVVGRNALRNCYGLTSLTVAEGVRQILYQAFTNCDQLPSLHLPSTIDSLGRDLFSGCDMLREVTMSEDNPKYCIADNALYTKDGSQLLQVLVDNRQQFEVPHGVTSLGQASVCYLRQLQTLVIPSTVTRLGQDAVYQCPVLSHVVCRWPVPPAISAEVFRSANLAQMTLHVPQGTLPNYLAAEGWNRFARIVEDQSNSVVLPRSDAGITPAAHDYDVAGRRLASPPHSRSIVISGRKGARFNFGKKFP